MGTESDTVRNQNGNGKLPVWLSFIPDFIAKVGFPIAVATALIVYLYMVGFKQNELMARAITVLERFEARDKANGR